MRRGFMSVFVSLAFVLLVGIEVQGQYIRPTTQPPSSSDLVSREGIQKTVIVQIINLTPYDIQLKDTNAGGSLCAGGSDIGCPSLTSSSVTEADQAEMMNTNRETHKSFMFAPVGIPRFIPKTPDQAFEPPQILCSPNSTEYCPNPKYDPRYYNTETRLYSMVFSWDDHNGYVQHSWVRWTVKGVDYRVCAPYPVGKHPCSDGSGCDCYKQDVDLGLWMDRVNATTETGSGAFPLASGALFTAFHTCALVVEWENPMAWIEAAVSAAELAKGIAEFVKENGQEAENDNGEKMFLASYTIPTEPTATTSGSICGSGKLACGPSFVVPIESRDAVDSGWALGDVSLADGTGAGPAALEVSTELLRGLGAPPCPQGPTGSHTCDLGRVPIFTITVMRAGDWQSAKLACLATPGCGGGGIYNPTAGASASSASIADSSVSVTDPIREKIRLFLLQAGAGKIGATLDHYSDRRAGLLALAAVIRGLPPADWEVLREMAGHALAGELPTKQERDLVHLIGAAYQKRLTGKEE